MPRRRAPRKSVKPTRRLALEALERREVFSLAPIHAVLPASGMQGARLLPDGNIAIDGLGPQGVYSSPNLVTNDQGILVTGPVPIYGPTEWIIAPDGQTISTLEIDPRSGAPSRGVEVISPNGEWLGGQLPPATPGESGAPVLWRRGSTADVLVGLPADRSGSAILREVSNAGDAIYQLSASDGNYYYAWDHAAGLLPLRSLYAVEGNTTADGAQLTLQAISADGKTIVGTSGGGSLAMRATVWVNGVAQELSAGGHESSCALSVSDDGHVVGGYVASGSSSQPAVWVDGQLTLLTTETGAPANDAALRVVHGVGGNPNAWAAMGSTWIANSDGVVHPFSTYLPEHYGLSLTGDNQVIRLLADDQATYIVTFENTHSLAYVDCVGCYQPYVPPHIVGHLLVLPNDYVPPQQADRLDLSGDHRVSPLDALILINAINAEPAKTLFDRPELRLATPTIDVNGDGELSASDALQVINFINAATSGASAANSESPGEGESVSSTSDSDLSALADDEIFRELTAPRRR